MSTKIKRELMDWKKTNFMAQYLGDEFDTIIIISLTNHGQTRVQPRRAPARSPGPYRPRCSWP
jgi:hypothetical protein